MTALLGFPLLLSLFPQDTDYRKELSKVQSELRRDFYVPKESGVPILGMTVAITDLDKINKRFGERAETFRLMAAASVRAGAYNEAANFAKKALQLDTEDKEAARIQQDAEHRSKLAALCPDTPLFVEQVGSDRWAVVTAKKIEGATGILGNKPWLRDARVHLVSDSKFLQTFTPFLKDWEGFEVSLVKRDFDGDKKPELVAWGVHYGGGGWRPIAVNVMSLRNGKLVSVGAVSESYGMGMADLKRTGKTQIIASHEIGFPYLNTGSALRPRWGDVYVLESGKLRTANERFADEFADETQEIAKLGKVASWDPEILLYQARLLAIRGDKKGASRKVAEAERVERSVRTDLLSGHGGVGSDVADTYLQQCAEVRKKIKTLKARLKIGKGL